MSAENNNPDDPLEIKAVETAREIAREYMRQMMDLGERIDRFSTWALGAAGAAVALEIGQLSKIQSQLGGRAAHALIWTLAASVLAGIFQKYCAVATGAAAAAREAQSKVLTGLDVEALKQTFASAPSERQAHYRKLMLGTVIVELFPAVPWPLRWIARGAVLKRILASEDSSLGQSFRAMIWQLLLTTVQLIALAVAVVIAASAVSA